MHFRPPRLSTYWITNPIRRSAEENGWNMTRIESKVVRFLRENPGADFIAAFLVALTLVAFIYPFDQVVANQIVDFAFFSLIAGIILEILIRRRGIRPNDEEGKGNVQTKRKNLEH